jgi:hypothetical protein
MAGGGRRSEVEALDIPGAQIIPQTNIGPGLGSMNISTKRHLHYMPPIARRADHM